LISLGGQRAHQTNEAAKVLPVFDATGQPGISLDVSAVVAGPEVRYQGLRRNPRHRRGRFHRHAHRTETAGARRQVVGIDNLNDYYDPALKPPGLEQLKARPGFRFERIDVADRAALEALFARNASTAWSTWPPRPACVTRSPNPTPMGTANLVGFLNVLEGCRQHGVASGLRQQLQRLRRQHEDALLRADNVDHPVSLYAATKKANELMAHTYSHLYGLPTTGLRFFTVYGPWGRPDMALLLFTRPSSAGRPIDGVQPRPAAARLHLRRRHRRSS
jgi:nucleoside-diphosphate-sugar epimerase